MANALLHINLRAYMKIGADKLRILQANIRLEFIYTKEASRVAYDAGLILNYLKFKKLG